MPYVILLFLLCFYLFYFTKLIICLLVVKSNGKALFYMKDEETYSKYIKDFGYNAVALIDKIKLKEDNILNEPQKAHNGLFPLEG